MYVVSLIVKNEFGVMQRVMGEFTRNKINVETIVVGKCELPGKSRIVLSMISEEDANKVAVNLARLQDVFDVRKVPQSEQFSFALMSSPGGNVGEAGGREQIEGILDSRKPEQFLKTLSAL